jgi:hypothetical protein
MIITSKSVWIHVPKTGGTWIRTALEGVQLHFSTRIIYPGHHKASTAPPRPFYFAFVRNPWAWYVSHYYFNRWHWENRTGSFSLPESQWCDDQLRRVQMVQGSFHDYLKRVDPGSTYCQRSLGARIVNLCDVPNVHFYRQEDLPGALFQAFEDAGHGEIHPVRRERIRQHPHQMVTPHPPYQECYTPAERDFVAELERDIIESHGYKF